MGRLRAMEMASATKEGIINIDAALEYHLRCNHYPPVPTSMIPTCKLAIDKANDGKWDEQVQLPKGITWKGFDCAPVREIVQAHHLEDFLESDDGA